MGSVLQLNTLAQYVEEVIVPILRKSVLVFLFVFVASAHAQVIDDFNRENTEIANTPALVASLVKIEDQPGVEHALALDWSDKHGAWVECAYAKQRTIPGFDPTGMMAIQLRLWVPASPVITQMSVRLFDRYYETYQWSASVPQSDTAGWRTVTIPIDLRKPNGHWGPRNMGYMGFPLKLSGYAFVFTNRNAPAGRVMVADVRAIPLLKATLETDRFPSLVNASADGKCDLLFTNPADHAVKLAVSGMLKAFDDQTTPVSGSLEIPAGGQARLPLPLSKREPGIYWLDAAFDVDGLKIGYQDSFVIADPVERVSKPDDFLFSICSHPERLPADQQEQEMQAAAAAGASVLRISVAWVSLEPKPGEWHWEVQDHLVDLAAKYGMETQPILGYGPAHAVSPELRAQQTEAYKNHQADAWKITLFGPPELEPWKKYVAAMVERYRGRIRFYEIWNEPDLSFWRGTTDQYIQLLRTAYQEIHRIDPNAKVMTGGFATVLAHAGRAKNPNLQERVLSQASDSFDIHAFHQHGPFPEFKEAVDGELQRIRRLMSHPRPLYFNETAISSTFGGEKFQAGTLAKKVALAMARGAMGYTWYDLRNDGANVGDPEHNYGLLTQSFQPKAAYAAYIECVRQLQTMHSLGELNLGEGREAFAFGNADRGRVVVWWNEGRFAEPLPVLFASGGKPVNEVDIMGNSRELPQADGIVLATPDEQPRYLTFAVGEGAPKMLDVLLALKGSDEVAAGQPVQLTGVLTNPLSREMVVALTWRDADGKQVSRSMTVPAHASASTPIQLAASTAGASRYDAQVRFAVEGLPWSGVSDFAAPVVHVVTTDAPDERPPDWVLNRRTDVVNFTEADPALASLHWKGENDLSARVWVWHRQQALRIRVDVRDDVHVQKEKASDSWRGDGIQLAFQLPGAKDYWELGAAQTNDGQTLRAAWTTPAGIEGADGFFDVACTPIEGGLRYEFTLPDARFGFSPQLLQRGLRFNLIVNDNDGNLRKQFIRIAPGIGETKDPSAFPIIHMARIVAP